MKPTKPETSFSIGMVLFEGVTQLDLTGPYEVLARMPNAQVHLIASSLTPVRTEWGLTIIPDCSFDDAPLLDLICVPGGWGVDAHLDDERLLTFLRVRGRDARYVTSVCSGALLLGAAGLLRGYRATTHWLSLDLLPFFGAEPVDERVVRDRNRITGGRHRLRSRGGRRSIRRVRCPGDSAGDRVPSRPTVSERIPTHGARRSAPLSDARQRGQAGAAAGHGRANHATRWRWIMVRSGSGSVATRRRWKNHVERDAVRAR